MHHPDPSAGQRYGPLLLPLIVACAGVVISVIAFYPGTLPNDAITFYQQVKGGYWHGVSPPTMRHLWWLTDKIVCGSGGLFLVHVLAWWAAALAFSTGLSRNAVMRASLVAAIGFFPPMFGLQAPLLTDISMTSFLLLGAGIVLHLHRRWSWPMAIAALVFLFYGGMTRHNAPPALIPLFALFAMALLQRNGASGNHWRAVSGYTALLFLVLVAGLQLINRAGTTHLGSTSEQFMTWDLAVMSVAQARMLVPAEVQADPGPDSLERLSAVINRSTVSTLFWGDPVFAKFFLAPEESRILRKAWFSAIIQYPWSYLKHRARLTLGLLGLGHKPPWGATSFRTTTRGVTDHCNAEWLPNRFQWNSLNSGIAKILEVLKQTPVYRAWLYMLLALAVIVQSLRRPSPLRFFAVLLALSGLLYFLPYPLLSPSSETRYVLWTMVAAWVSVLIAFLPSRSNSPATIEASTWRQ